MLVVLRPGVLALPEPGPEVLLDVVVGVRTDLREIISRPAVDVLGDREVAVEVEPLGGGRVPEGEGTLGRARQAPGCSARKSMSR